MAHESSQEFCFTCSLRCKQYHPATLSQSWTSETAWEIKPALHNICLPVHCPGQVMASFSCERAGKMGGGCMQILACVYAVLSHGIIPYVFNFHAFCLSYTKCGTSVFMDTWPMQPHRACKSYTQFNDLLLPSEILNYFLTRGISFSFCPGL